MSVTSVQPDRPTPYPPISGNNSRGKFATTLAPDRAAPTDRQNTAEAGYADPTDARQFQSALEQARRGLYSGMIPGWFLGNFANVSPLIFRVCFTISGGLWVNQSDSETSA